MATHSPLSSMLPTSMLRVLKQHLPPTSDALLLKQQQQQPKDRRQRRQRTVYWRLTLPSAPHTGVWGFVDVETRRKQSVNGYYWWRHAGTVLATLLHEAGYSVACQTRCLRFFVDVVVHSMGRPHAPGRSSSPAWHSFMTDDGLPIELSWDWGKDGDSKPGVRYAIEPVSPYSRDSWSIPNRYEASAFHERVRQALPSTDLVWYDHFHSLLADDCLARDISGEQGHSTQIFHGFDLKESGTTCKAYFFPAYKSRAESRSTLDVISESILTAPDCSSNIKAGLDAFVSFVGEREGVEMDMLAIDLVSPESSRIKIYFRLRETTFTSVQATMTLNGRLKSAAVDRGLEEIRKLWGTVFEVDDLDNRPLGSTSHRTSGILYYVEFKNDSPNPSVKLYMPVRHYARSDEHIASSLCNYLRERGRASQSDSYLRALGSLL